MFFGQLTTPDRFLYHTGYGEPPAGSSQLHSMTLAAPGRGELRLILAAASCTLRHWLHPAGVSFSWRGQLSRAGNKHSSGQCVKVIFNFLLQQMYSDRRGYGQKQPRTKPSRQKTPGQKPPDKSPREQLRENLYGGFCPDLLY